MKKLLLLSITIAFSFTAKAQRDSYDLSVGILEALKSGKFEDLQKLVAPPSIYKAKFKGVDSLSDEQIKEKTSHNPKLKADFEKLLANAKEKKVDLSKMKYKTLDMEMIRDGVYAITITFSIGDKTGKLAISGMNYVGNANWYIMEILITSRAFRDF